MATYNLNDGYSVTVTVQKKRGGFDAIGEIYSRKTQKKIGVAVKGSGRTIAAAQDRAVQDAKSKCPA